MAIIDALGYSKVCASWVPRNLTTEHRRQRKAICSELLERFDSEGEAFLSRIVTGEEIWAHHYEPEKKRQSMEWHHPQSPRKKKFKTTPSAGKLMITVFWDIDGVILVDVMTRGDAIKTLQKLKQRCRLVIQHERQCPLSHKSTNPGGNHQIWMECAPPSPL